MRYFSTQNPEGATYSFDEAVMNGRAPDGGLFVPCDIPRLPQAFFKNISRMSLKEVCFAVANYALQGDVEATVLKDIIYETMNYDMPLKEVEKDRYMLELFHGPTLNFKDSGARLFGRLLSYIHKRQTPKRSDFLNVLLTTSGNTGSAVANGLLGMDDVRVFVLYPVDVLSPMQEALFTTLGKNVTAIEVNGTIDDCKNLAQKSFSDIEVSEKMRFTSATSTNIARLLPQMFHYFWVYACLQRNGRDVNNIVVSVPCGNLGNLLSGLIAKRMGLPIKRFVAAENVNHPFVNYLNNGEYIPMFSAPSIAPALDKGNPRNIARIKRLYDNDVEALRKDVSGVIVTDEMAKQEILHQWKNHKYLLDPHSAVASAALSQDLQPGEVGVALCTAHPVKLRRFVQSIINEPIVLPVSITPLAEKPRQIIHINSGFKSLKDYFLSL